MQLIELFSRKRMKTAGRFSLKLLRGYFRVEVKGIEHLPKKGRALITPNHSGFAGADAVLLTSIIKRETRRRPRILAHRSFFDFSNALKDLAEGRGLKRASVQGGIDVLKNDRLLILFPEGESGNFKSSFNRYKLQHFHTGFLRMALEADAPIIPCTIVGAEEANFNLGNINLGRWAKNIRIPLPLNLIPLPSKWRIEFHAPIDPKKLLSSGRLQTGANQLKRRMQKRLDTRVRKRSYVYSRSLRKLIS
jgi:1-acyl-sn-glycerol-3-phosphate acyltransferase